MIYRARCLLPIGERAIDNGAVIVDSAGRIEWLGAWRSCDTTQGPVRDLGEVVLIPGLINAHCHLDYTSMAGKIPPPRYFPDWVKTILSFKAHWSFSEFAESWLKGARMLLRSGVTMVADIESAPELLPEVWKTTPLRVISFLEMTGVKTRRKAEEVLGETLEHIEKLPKLPGKEAALSPHALYSTTPELVKQSARTAREKNLLLSAHLAESESEFQMFTECRGPFYEWLKDQRDMKDCAGVSPVRLAHQYGLLGPDFLAVHVNYLAPGDEDILARSGSTVVHCPRSHEYFGHDPFPFERLSKAGVNICLGTDSLATVRKKSGEEPQLDLWREIRLFAETNPAVHPREIMKMATTRPAAALKKEKDAGQLAAGRFFDAVGVEYEGTINENGLAEHLVFEGRARNVVLGGELMDN